jgi:hypothetical protein
MTTHMPGVGRRFLVTAALATSATLVPAAVTVAAPSGGALPPPVVQQVEIAGSYGVPDDAEMVAVNLTAVNTGDPGYLAVYACDDDRPETSNVNYLADQVVPNLALSALSADGTICIATIALTDVIVDVIGYVPAGSAITALATPRRFLDTREPGGAPSPVPAESTTAVQITGTAGIPDTARMVMANLTAVGGAEPGYLAAHPCGTATDGSSVNHLPGEVNANLVISALDADGRLCIDNLAPVDVIVDVVAWADEGITTLTAPERILDTRTGTTPPAGGSVRIDLTDQGVPAGATAAVYNLTATNTTAPGYLTSFPCDAARPLASNLNHGTNDTTANATITKLSAAGELCIYHLVSTDLIVDLIGYTTGTDHYVAITPARALDTRRGWDVECGVLLVIDDSSSVVAIDPGGQRTALDAPDTANGKAAIAPDCSNAYAVDGNGLAWRVPLDGSTAESLEQTGLYPVYTTPFPLDDGRVLAAGLDAGGTEYRVVDIETGEVLTRFPNRGGLSPDFSMTSDGSLIGWWDLSFRIAEVATGDVVFESDRLPKAVVSPDGRYVAYSFVLDQRAVYEVATLDGVVVHRWSPPELLSPGTIDLFSHRWVAPGVIAINKYHTPAYRGTLFGGLRAIPNLGGNAFVDYR